MTHFSKITVFEEYDDETGEITITPKVYDSETGEEEYMNLPPVLIQKQKVFKIPLTKPPDKKTPQLKEPARSAALGKLLLYLLPTTILFYPILSIVIVLTEAALHIWAHKKNKILISKNVQHRYQSPLHIICREFCAKCRDEESTKKISKFQERMQDRFLHKYGLEYVRRVVT